MVRERMFFLNRLLTTGFYMGYVGYVACADSVAEGGRGCVQIGAKIRER